MVTFPLPPTKTFPVRSMTWQRVTPDGSLVVGVLQFTEQRSEDGKVYVSRYAVVESTYINGKVFRVTKGDEEKSVYFVYLSDNPEYDDLCDCVGFANNRWCRHTISLSILEAKGELNGLFGRVQTSERGIF